MTTTGSLTCYQSLAEQIVGVGFQLCAIRVYISPSGAQKTVSNGLWSTNAFRRLIGDQHCQSFTSTTDVGVSSCDPMPYETVTNFTLCICAGDQCNENLETCTTSVANQAAPVRLSSSMPVLNDVIECANTSQTAFVCAEHDYINKTVCDEYVRTRGALCSIVLKGTNAKQAVLPSSHYQLFLDQTVHRLTRISQSTNRSRVNESTDNFYFADGSADANIGQECVCTHPAACNDKINACAPLVFQETVTITTSTSTGVSSYSAAVTQLPSATSGSTARNAVNGESGLGGAAIAGITSGIILSALAVTAEIVFFKFFSSAASTNGFDPSVRYQV